MYEKNRSRVRFMTRTGILIAMLIALQWSTAPTQAFAGQYITGSLVNCVLAVTALFGGLLSGIVVALLSPFCAFLLGIGPKLLQIVPCIALGNLAFVLVLYFLMGRKTPALWQHVVTIPAGAVVKFLTLNLLVVRVVIPLMGEALKPKQVETFSLMFSYPQLITALLGGILAMLLAPILRKAIKQ